MANELSPNDLITVRISGGETREVTLEELWGQFFKVRVEERLREIFQSAREKAHQRSPRR